MVLENKRLMLCAELIAEDSFAGADGAKRAADVGTDHGYLAAYLAGEGICQRVTACDINEKPLAQAERTVKENRLTDKIKLVLSDGLDSVENDGITHVICAGMGGELIAEIVLRCEWTRGVHLVLQPMTKADFLRGRLYENGFCILRERAVRDGDFVYSVMLAEHTSDPIDYPCDPLYLTAGRLKAGEGDAEEYFLMRAERLRRAAKGMSESTSETTRAEGEKLLRLAEKLSGQVRNHER